MEGDDEDRKLGRDGQDTESTWHGCTSSRTPPGVFRLLRREPVDGRVTGGAAGLLSGCRPGRRTSRVVGVTNCSGVEDG